MSGSSTRDDELKRRAVEEIFAETKRAAVRADIGGASGWLKPNHKGFNKRFLNNTVISAVSNNCRVSGVKPLVKQPPAKVSAKAAYARNTEESKKTVAKIRVSNKSRFQAYLAAKKRATEKEIADSTAESAAADTPESAPADTPESIVANRTSENNTSDSPKSDDNSDIPKSDGQPSEHNTTIDLTKEDNSSPPLHRETDKAARERKILGKLKKQYQTLVVPAVEAGSESDDVDSDGSETLLWNSLR